MSGIAVGSKIQRGDVFKVISVDREAERIRMEVHRIEGKLQRGKDRHQVQMTPYDCNRWGLQRQKPEISASDWDRQVGRNLTGIFED